MDDVFVRLTSGLPPSIKGAVRLDADGNYNVYINAAHSTAVNLATLAHELRHIKHGDLMRFGDVDEMEVDADG